MWIERRTTRVTRERPREEEQLFVKNCDVVDSNAWLEMEQTYESRDACI